MRDNPRVGELITYELRNRQRESALVGAGDVGVGWKA